jgi:hypothetical protein
MITFEMKGVAECIKILKELKNSVTRYDVEKAAEIALEPVLQSAQSNLRTVVRERTGKLAKSLRLKRMNPKLRRTYYYFAGMVVTADDRKAHLVEYGTGSRRRKRRGATGEVKARPFLRPAYDAHRGRIMDRAAKELGLRLQKKINRAVRQNAVK